MEDIVMRVICYLYHQFQNNIVASFQIEGGEKLW